jgi:hypothetical protein
MSGRIRKPKQAGYMLGYWPDGSAYVGSPVYDRYGNACGATNDERPRNLARRINADGFYCAFCGEDLYALGKSARAIYCGGACRFQAWFQARKRNDPEELAVRRCNRPSALVRWQENFPTPEAKRHAKSRGSAKPKVG